MNERGYLALVSILVVLSVALTVGLTLSFALGNEMRMNLNFKKSKEAFYLAESCMQKALLELQRDSAYRGEELTFASGSCTMNITRRRIETLGVVDDTFYRRIVVEYQRSPWQVLTWRER